MLTDNTEYQLTNVDVAVYTTAGLVLITCKPRIESRSALTTQSCKIYIFTYMDAVTLRFIDLGRDLLVVHFVARLQVLNNCTKSVGAKDSVKAILVQKLTGSVLPRIGFENLRRFELVRKVRPGIRLLDLLDSRAKGLTHLFAVRQRR